MIGKKALPWTILLLIAALSAGGVVLYTRGIDRGYSNAIDGYEDKLVAMESQYRNRQRDRDAQWLESVGALTAVLEQERLTREADLENERKLQEQLRTLRDRVLTIQREIYEADVGSCVLSPEFDRLFDISLGPASAGDGTSP